VKQKGFLVSAVAALTAMMLTVGCTGSESSGSNGSERMASISGSVASSSFQEARVGSARNENGTMSLTLADLEVYVIYFTGTKVDEVRADVNPATGSWTFDVPLNSQITAIVRDKTTLDIVGPITFVNSLEKDMSGNDKESLTFSFNAGASLGAIELSEDGKFKVAVTPALIAVANVTSTVPAQAFDFSGSWTLNAFSGTLPPTHKTACAPGAIDCHGPTAGEPIYLAKLTGKKFSYTGGTCATYATSGTGSCLEGAGTIGTDDVHAAQIWAGGSVIQACGFKTGFAADDARAFGRIHLDPADMPIISGSGVTVPTQLGLGRVTFSTPAGYGEEGNAWMKTGALSDWDIMDCKNIERTGSDSKKYNLNVCSGTLSNAASGYQAMGPGGCIDSTTGKPVIVKDWMTLNGLTATHGNSTHPALADMNIHTSTYTGVSGSVASSAAFTCTHVYGIFSDAGATVPVPSVYMASFNKVTAGATCSGIGDDLQRYRCYANAYYKDDSRNESGCSMEYRFNWQASTIADFVSIDGSRDKPKGQHLTGVVTYSPDGKSFTLEDEENLSVSVQNGEASIICRIANKTILKATSVNASTILVDLTESAFLKDSTIAACVGEKNNSTADGGHGSELYRRLSDGNQKFLFTLNK